MFIFYTEIKDENLFHSARDPSCFFIWGIKALYTNTLNTWISFFSMCIL